MRHVMVDLETWGTNPGCAIRSIGAVQFDPEKLVFGESFYVNVTKDSCVEAGLHIDPDTEAWWLRQTKEAQDALETAPVPLYGALDMFSDWFWKNGLRYMWSNGPNFDDVILAACYRATDIKQPWKFYQSFDLRTILHLTGVKVDRSEGTHHNAYDDARQQARAVMKAYKRLDLLKTNDQSDPTDRTPGDGEDDGSDQQG